MRNKLTPACSSPAEKTRLEMTALLQEWLADSIDLMMQARQAQRNVRGRNFNALHELFDKVYTDAGKYVNLISHRIAQLGGIAQDTLRLTSRQSSLPECALDIANGKKHVEEHARAIAF